MCGGKVVMFIAIRTAQRITPACAGKSALAGAMQNHFRDHPRMCGEKRVRLAFICGIWGSPPHMRGKADSPSARFRIDGITPAHAGKRAGQHLAAAPQRDHPRTCGEKGISDFSGNYEDGSPPHMRGKANKAYSYTAGYGITPACAGKRSGPSPAAVPAGPAGSCPASRPSQFPPRMTVISPRP